MSKNHYIIPVFVPHIGCPHDCVFCNQNTITGKKKITMVNEEELDPNRVNHIIKTYLYTINKTKNKDAIVEISFFGGTFTAIPMNKQEELLKVAFSYKTQGDIDYIRLSTRPDYIDNVRLGLLKKYSVDIIELGVQSLDREVLKYSGRGHSDEDVYSASKLIKEFGFTLGIQIMLGLPGDTMKKDIETAVKVSKIHPEIARIYPALVIKDTPMETMVKRGQYEPYTLFYAIEVCKITYSILVSKGINVVRVGLQPTEDINENAELICGPFHPAFRELMESSLLNEMIFTYMNLGKINSDILLKINPKNISKLYSNKKYYFNFYKEKHGAYDITVVQDPSMDLDKVVIDTCKEEIELSYMKFLNNKSEEGKRMSL
ncbi:elongator complex protein 3 [Hathewaya massiliensis]|uniref:elongator complex protein 3 n=1 Tax=Hathewaya massiliensis TaxID=1964382 RepID=UPI00115B8D53|nr:radical SAM protein [Hathewaya massiliensis]